MNDPLLAIDPGLHSMGVAYWPRGGFYLTPHWTALVKSKDPEVWTKSITGQIVELHSTICRALIPFKCRPKVVIELPAYHGSSAAGIAAAASIIKLSILVGGLAEHFRNHEIEVALIPVRDWKGQLPKEVVIHRIRQKLGDANCKEFKKDIWDAVGIGLFAMGVEL